jgi:hypothetical protein
MDTTLTLSPKELLLLSSALLTSVMDNSKAGNLEKELKALEAFALIKASVIALGPVA